MRDLQHNLVSMLYAIKGMAETHVCRNDEGRFKDDAEALQHARNVIDRIYAKSNQAMRVAKKISLSSKQKSTIDPKDLNVSVESAWKRTVYLLEKRYLFKELEVVQHIPKEFPNIQCHEKDLVEIFYHLSQNAIQAMKKKGKLVIRLNLEIMSDDPLATIMIADTGPGIPKEILSNLFEPFFTTKPVKEGNGLGLCIVKSLVKRNNGKISVSSFEGCGTTFTLSFPLASAKNVEQEYLVIN